ncbi:MAG: cytochrome c-type biogenesis protein [Gammaproteobacteria bacterium]
MRPINILLMVGGLWLTLAVHAAIDTYQFSSDESRERFQKLTSELRCPKCQNQNIADSNAEIAKDLRTKVFQMLEKGKTNDEIINYMTDRYGEFVLYEPKFNARTLLLWGGPVMLLLLGLTIVFWLSRRRFKADDGPDASGLDNERQSRLQKILEDDKDTSQ